MFLSTEGIGQTNVELVISARSIISICSYAVQIFLSDEFNIFFTFYSIRGTEWSDIAFDF